jgi:flagellin-specific chaperone FliS
MLAIINGAKAETGSPADARTIADKAEIGTAYAIEAGLTDVENAEAAMAEYDVDDRDGSLAAAQEMIDGFRAAAGEEDSTEIVVELVGLGADPLAV